MNHTIILRQWGSNALLGKLLDPGLLKISWIVFFLLLDPAGSPYPEGPILIPFLALRGKANIYLT